MHGAVIPTSSANTHAVFISSTNFTPPTCLPLPPPSQVLIFAGGFVSGVVAAVAYCQQAPTQPVAVASTSVAKSTSGEAEQRLRIPEWANDLEG